MAKQTRRLKPPNEKQVRTSLLNHLEAREMLNDVFQDLVNQYMTLWQAAQLCQEDIANRGISYKDVSSTGKEMWKNNPSVSELVKVSGQMQKIRKELGYEPGSIAQADDAHGLL